MQIVEDQQQRLHRGGVLEEPGGRLEQVEARRIGLARGNRGDRGRPKAFAQAGDHLGDMGRPRTQPGGKGLLVTVFGESTDQLHPRPERRCAPTLPAATPQDLDPSLGRVPCKVLGQPGLADPRLPSDQEQPSPAAGGVLQAGHQLRNFPVPAHECLPCSAPGRIPHRRHRTGQPNARPPPPIPRGCQGLGHLGADRADLPAQRFPHVERPTVDLAVTAGQYDPPWRRHRRGRERERRAWTRPTSKPT